MRFARSSATLGLALTLGIGTLPAAPSLAGGGGGSQKAKKADFNGDGVADLAVGVPGEDIVENKAVEGAGAVNVLYGSAIGPGTEQPGEFWNEDTAGVRGAAEPFEGFGESLATGDFNRDGFADLVVSTPGSDVDGIENAGQVHVLYGSSSGVSAAGDDLWSQGVEGIQGVVEDDEKCGVGLAVANFGKTKHDDLAIGCPGDGESGAETGGVIVLYGSNTGLGVDGNKLWTQFNDGSGVTFTHGKEYGVALAAGNFGGGPEADLAVGAPGEGVPGLSLNSGAVHVLYGTPTGLKAADSQVFTQDTPGVNDQVEQDDAFGRSLATGNFGKSKQADLAISVHLEGLDFPGQGAVAILFGSEDGLRGAGDQLIHRGVTDVEGEPEDGAAFGEALAAANFGKSTRADLAVGAPSDHPSKVNQGGAVQVLYGSDTGLSGDGDQIWHQDTPGIAAGGEQDEAAQEFDGFGRRLGAANYGRGGLSDLVVGVPGEDVGVITTENCGVVHIIFGRENGLQANNDLLIGQDSGVVADVCEQDDEFGSGLIK